MKRDSTCRTMSRIPLSIVNDYITARYDSRMILNLYIRSVDSVGYLA